MWNTSLISNYKVTDLFGHYLLICHISNFTDFIMKSSNVSHLNIPSRFAWDVIWWLFTRRSFYFYNSHKTTGCLRRNLLRSPDNLSLWFLFSVVIRQKSNGTNQGSFILKPLLSVLLGTGKLKTSFKYFYIYGLGWRLMLIRRPSNISLIGFDEINVLLGLGSIYNHNGVN